MNNPSSTVSGSAPPGPQSATNGIPLSWVHPDLRRQLYDKVAQQNQRGITRIIEREEILHQQCLQLVKGKLDCEERKQQLLLELQHLDESITAINTDLKSSSSIVEDIRVQRSFQQNWIKERQFIDVTAGDLLDSNTISLQADASNFSIFSHSSNSPLEIHFLHLFLNPGLWNACSSSSCSPSCADSTTTDPQNKKIPPSHSPDLPDWNQKKRSHKLGKAFLRQYFPVLEWNMDSSSNATEPVIGPSFFEQPCQMEMTSLLNANDNDDSSNGNNMNSVNTESSRTNGGNLGCTNAACLFWHKDQLRHMKIAYGKTIRDICMRFCTRDRRICAASDFFMEAYERLYSSSTVSDFCTGLVFTASEIIRLGWHVLLVECGSPLVHPDGGKVWKNTRRVVTRPWITPIALDGANGERVPPTQTCTAAHVWLHELLRNDTEKRFWQILMERHEIVLRERGGNSSLNIKNTLKEASLGCFTEFPTALAWRFVIRCTAENLKQQRWLAHRGWKLFPSSPHLALLYVLSLSQESCLSDHPSENSWEPEKVVNICMDVASTLTAQCASCLYMQDPEVSVGYPSLTARYIAYMIAVTAFRVARREHLQILPEVNEKTERHALRLLTAAAEPGRFFLLPIALQNMVLLLTALQQQQHLNGLDVLPLGAISDHVLMVTNAHFTSSEQHRGSGSSTALNQQLQLLNRRKSDTISTRVLEELKSSAQLSLVRLFRVRLEVMEQLLIKASTLHGSMSQTTLWMEYLYMIERQDGPGFSRQMSAQILESLSKAKVKKRSLVLLLLLYWRLQAQWSSVCSETEWLAQILSETVTSLTEYDQHSAGNEEEAQNGKTHQGINNTDNPLVDDDIEHVAFEILKSYQKVERPQEQLDYLQKKIVDKQFCHDANSVILLLIAMLQLCSHYVRKDWFESSVQLAIMVLHEQHLMWWSSLDVLFEGVIGISHYVLLVVFKMVPLLLGPYGGGTATKEWRQCILEVGARCGALHPLLREANSAA